MVNFNLTKAEALKAAIRRLPLDYPGRAYLEKELHNAEAGMRGEERLRKKFNDFYSEEPYEMMWDVSLSLGTWKVQIDGLLITGKAAIIIESKNISGDLYFNDDTDEFYRIDSDGIKTVMDNPVTQVEKHIRFMEAWFAVNAIQLPVDGILVFTAKRSELQTIPRHVHTCRVHQMTEKLVKIMKQYPTPLYSDNSLDTFKQLINSKKTPYKHKTLSSHYSINLNDYKKGVYCTRCELPTIEKRLRKWSCVQCGEADKNAPVQAIREYFALIGGPVTNAKIREFTGIKDRHVVKRLLETADLQKQGKKRHRQYSIK